MPDLDEIRRIADAYFDGLYEGSADTLAGIFHPSSRLFFVNDDKTTIIEIAAYLDIVRNRQSPRQLNAARNDELLGISINSPNAAVISLRILLAGKRYSDQLCLVRENGKWSIMSKFYYLLGAEPVAG